MIQPPVDFREHILSDVHILRGKPCIRGTRVPVYVILDALGAGESFAEVMQDYPSVKMEDIRACFAYAARLTEEEIIPINALARPE